MSNRYPSRVCVGTKHCALQVLSLRAGFGDATSRMEKSVGNRFD